MDWYSPKHVEHLMENKVQSQEYFTSCWFIYILNVKFHDRIHPARTELFQMNWRTDGQTDVTKVIIAFLNSTKEPKSGCSSV